ncbi:MAG: hypothetical protein ACTSVZ_13885 [Promethearchaeota archaeon]
MDTKVVGIRISDREKFLWQTYAKAENYSLGDLIYKAVDQFLHPLQIYYLDPIIAQFMDALNIQLEKISEKHLVTLTFRITKESLENWDQFISEHFYTRTILIRQAMQSYFSVKSQLEYKFRRPESSTLILNSIYNVIHYFGPLSFEQIAKVFSHIDRSIIRVFVYELEENWRVGRNWGAEYYTFEKHADLAQNIIQELDQTHPGKIPDPKT